MQSPRTQPPKDAAEGDPTLAHEARRLYEAWIAAAAVSHDAEAAAEAALTRHQDRHVTEYGRTPLGDQYQTYADGSGAVQRANADDRVDAFDAAAWKARLQAQEHAAANPPGDEEVWAAALQEHRAWLESDGAEGRRLDLRLSTAPLAPQSASDDRRERLLAADMRKVNLRGADLRGADLNRLDLRGADLRGATLRGARLIRADLRGADLREVKPQGATLEGADLRGADLRALSLGSTSLRGADMSGADLRDADLGHCDLRIAKARGANLRGAGLDRAGMDGADFRGADLRQASLRFAKALDADFRGADFRGADMTRMSVFGANLDGARLEGVTGLPERISRERANPARAGR